jgi:hypothetical protein
MVDGAHINNVLAHPKDIAVNHLAALEETLREFPYFQAARSIYLKGLKSESSPLYNKELQKTAAHTTDRSVLFDFITSESFSQNKVSERIKLLQQQENEIEIEVEKPEEGITNPVKKNTQEEDFNANKDFTKVADLDLFEKKKESSIFDEPLDFDKNETYSFSRWLQLSSLKPIDRKKENTEDETSTAAQEIIQEADERAIKMARIDQFLAEKPKIRPRKSSSSHINIADHYEDPSQFMTETLARVYLAQKNYSKALKAYEVLVLQHPEKSGLFADQIQEIKNLQSNHT